MVVRILAAERVVLALKRQGKEYWREATKPTCLSKIEGAPKGCSFSFCEALATTFAQEVRKVVRIPSKAEESLLSRGARRYIDVKHQNPLVYPRLRGTERLLLFIL